MKSLNQKQVDIFYLHAPDSQVSLLQSLEACNELYKEGLFKELGLSNYAAWEVTFACCLCKQHGFIRPTVYQGMYNCVTRAVEAELLQALRVFGMRFYVYNPLAGGMLTGKYLRMREEEKVGGAGRFTDANKMYRDRFWKDDYFNAIEYIHQAVEMHNRKVNMSNVGDLLEGGPSNTSPKKEKTGFGGAWDMMPPGKGEKQTSSGSGSAGLGAGSSKEPQLTLTRAALLWLTQHSQLKAELGDKVIIGASSMGQLEENLSAFGHDEKLPETVLTAMDAAWKSLPQEKIPCYFRGSHRYF